MIEQVSQAITFGAFFYDSTTFQGSTGLTVTVDVYRISDNTAQISDAAAVEVGGGFYKYVHLGASTGTESPYGAIFKTTNVNVSQRQIPAWWSVGVAGIENLDATVATRSTVTTAQVKTEADAALTDYDPPTDTEMLAAFAALNDLSSAQATAACTSSLNTYDPPTKAEMDAALALLNDPTAATIWAFTTRTLTTYLRTEVTESSLAAVTELDDFYPGTTIIFSITCSISGVPQDITGDTVTLRVKTIRTDTDAAAAISKAADVATLGASGIATFTLLPTDTDVAEETTYHMDIVWETAGGAEYVVHTQVWNALNRISDY